MNKTRDWLKPEPKQDCSYSTAFTCSNTYKIKNISHPGHNSTKIFFVIVHWSIWKVSQKYEIYRNSLQSNNVNWFQPVANFPSSAGRVCILEYRSPAPPKTQQGTKRERMYNLDIHSTTCSPSICTLIFLFFNTLYTK